MKTTKELYADRTLALHEDRRREAEYRAWVRRQESLETPTTWDTVINKPSRLWTAVIATILGIACAAVLAATVIAIRDLWSVL